MCAEGVCVCLKLAGMAVMYFPEDCCIYVGDKNKHCNLAEWAVCYNFINLNGVCGLRECKCTFQFIKLSSSI